MESRAKIFGHPAHQSAVVLPAGLLIGAAIFDGIALGADDPDGWSEIAEKLIGAGLISAVVAAPFGVADWLAIPSGTRAKRIGAMHGLTNIAALSAFGASWMLRRERPAQPPVAARALSFAAVAALGFAGWLGGELVSRLGVGVADDARLDAPNSLDHDDEEQHRYAFANMS